MHATHWQTIGRAVLTALALASCTNAAPATPTTRAPAASTSAPAAVAANTSADVNITPLAQRATIKLSIAPNQPNTLPIMVAMDKGYFAQANLDIQALTMPGSASAVLPQVSQGQIDILEGVPAPNLFNQAAQGFNVKVIAGADVNKPGRIAAAYLLVEQDQVGAIKSLQDLRGKTIESAVQGTPISILVDAALQQAGLVAGTDVTVTYKVKSPADFLVIVQNHGADVVGSASAPAAQAEQMGLAVRWKNTADLTAWYQSTLWVVSDQFLSANRPAVEKFLEVYLRAAREVNATNGEWSDYLITLFATQSGTPADVVTRQGGIPQFDPNATVSMDSLSRTQEFLAAEGQIPQKVDIATLVDPSLAAEATRAIGGQT